MILEEQAILKTSAPRMTVAEAMDFAQKAFHRYKGDPSFEHMAEYNWWVDVVNFKAGKQVLPYQYEHGSVLRVQSRIKNFLNQ